jgi:hypothetical protein
MPSRAVEDASRAMSHKRHCRSRHLDDNSAGIRLGRDWHYYNVIMRRAMCMSNTAVWVVAIDFL